MIALKVLIILLVCLGSAFGVDIVLPDAPEGKRTGTSIEEYSFEKPNGGTLDMVVHLNGEAQIKIDFFDSDLENMEFEKKHHTNKVYLRDLSDKNKYLTITSKYLVGLRKSVNGKNYALLQRNLEHSFKDKSVPVEINVKTEDGKIVTFKFKPKPELKDGSVVAKSSGNMQERGLSVSSRKIRRHTTLNKRVKEPDTSSP